MNTQKGDSPEFAKLLIVFDRLTIIRSALNQGEENVVYSLESLSIFMHCQQDIGSCGSGYGGSHRVSLAIIHPSSHSTICPFIPAGVVMSIR